jgi:DNA invertase Pin-like site-specific DNA recombinase
MDGIAKARESGTRFGRKPELTPERVAQIRALRAEGSTVPEIMRQTGLGKTSVYRALKHATD